MTSQQSLTFVIPVRNDAARLRRCLLSIARNRPGAATIKCLVADNGSTDDSAAAARSLGADVVAIQGSPVSRVRNLAAAQTDSELLAFVDADHEISDSWVDAAIDSMADRTAGGVGALCLPPQKGTRVQQLYGALRGRTSGRSEVTWLGSGNLVVRRAIFEELGGFDEGLETCEDVDLCQRLRAKGWRLIGDERLVNYHLGDPATLRAVFTSERWRGRDNLRVSLRHKLSLRDVPSVVIPVLGAAALLSIPLALASVAVWGRAGLFWAAASLLLILALSALRTMRMTARGSISAALIPWAFAVALAYDLGRAVSLLLPARHRDRQRVEQPQARHSRS